MALDFESTPRFNLLLEAADGVNLAQVMVHINVVDVNDNPPEFVTETTHIAVVSVDSDPGIPLM